MNNVKNKFKNIITSYDYYLDEAKSVVRELEQGNEEDMISITYLEEKIKHLNEFLEQCAIAESRWKLKNER